MGLKRSIYQLYWALFVLATLVLSNCRKTEQPIGRVAITVTDIRSGQFFSDHLPTEPLAKAIREFVIREDQQHHFSEEYLLKIGTPRWDRVLSFYSAKNDRSNNENDLPDSTISYIPFVKGTQTQINVALVIRTVNNDTAFRLLYAKEYDDWGFDNITDQRQNPRDIFHLFAAMENAVFGTKKFSITDERLLTDRERAELAAAGLNWNGLKVTYSLNKQSIHQPAGKAIAIEKCDVISYCIQYGLKPFRAVQQISTNTTDLPCITWGTYTECWTQWIELPGYGDGGSGSSGGYTGQPGSGGSGSGTGTWPSPVDPAPCETGTGRMAELCEDAGWISLPELQVLAFTDMMAPGDGFEYDVLVNSFFQAFNSVYEFQVYKNNIGNLNNTTYNLSIPPTIINQQEKIKKARFNLNLIGGIDIDLKMEKVDNYWKIKEVDSDTWGLTPATTWKQGVYNQTLNGNEITVEVSGKLSYNIIIQGIGTIYKQILKFRIKVNNITGELISISRI